MSSEARRVEHQMTDKGYVPVYTTAVVEQPWASYSPTDHAVWGQLFRRQREILQGRACPEFLTAMDAMGMSDAQIPKFEELNVHLQQATGWKLIAVEGLLPGACRLCPRRAGGARWGQRGRARGGGHWRGRVCAGGARRRLLAARRDAHA